MKALLSFLCLGLSLAATAAAQPVTFQSNGLKYQTVIVLDVVDKSARGTFTRSEHEADPAPKVPFTGKVIPTPLGKKGVYLEIAFDPKTLAGEKAPYPLPPKLQSIVWHLKIVKGRAHLFVPTYQRNYQTAPARWVIEDDEYEPAEDAR